MSYFTVSEIEDLVPSGVKLLLDDTSYSEMLVANCDLKIQKFIGGEIPTTRDETLDWIVLPAACIVSKLALPKLNNITPELRTQITDDYRDALNELEKWTKHADYLDANSGTLTNIVEW